MTDELKLGTVTQLTTTGGKTVPAGKIELPKSERAADVSIFSRPFNEWPLDLRFKYCEYLAAAEDSLPVAYRGKPQKIFFAAERGARIGLSPTESVSNILVVNGATSVWGDMGMALIRKSGLLKAHDEWYEIDGVRRDGDDFDVMDLAKRGVRVVAFVRMTRRGEDPFTKSYSIEDAKAAGLWLNKDSWRKSPKEMLMWRPRSFVMRRKFQDVLMGFVTIEEARDITPEAERGEIAERSQPATKGADLAEKIGEEGEAVSVAMFDEMAMMESILTTGGEAATIGQIQRDLRVDVMTMNQEQAALYVRALSLAIDQMNAKREG